MGNIKTHENEKLLTISIAAFNVEPFIEKAVSSCLSEKINNQIEILVIDDGSTDATAQIAEKYEKQYPDTVRVIRKSNGGYGSTINTSISLARGKYFKQLDGDDWFDLNGLISLISNLQASEADLFITPYFKFSERSGETQIYDDLPELETGEYLIDDGIDISSAMRMYCLTFKTSVFRNMGRKITEHCFYTDMEYDVYPFVVTSSFHVSHVPVYCYRIGRDEQSMSILGIRKHFAEYEIVFQNLYTLYDSIKDKNTGYAKLIYKKFRDECISHYRYLCMLKVNSKNVSKLKELDRELKKFSDLYRELGERSKVIKYLRKTRFLAYYAICFVVRRKKEASF